MQMQKAIIGKKIGMTQAGVEWDVYDRACLFLHECGAAFPFFAYPGIVAFEGRLLEDELVSSFFLCLVSVGQPRVELCVTVSVRLFKDVAAELHSKVEQVGAG